jgi:hypothetical protein
VLYETFSGVWLAVGRGDPMTEVIVLADLKSDPWSRLCDARATVLAKADGLSEYDRRRPLTPTGTNLLGLTKHSGGEESIRPLELDSPGIVPHWAVGCQWTTLRPCSF